MFDLLVNLMNRGRCKIRGVYSEMGGEELAFLSTIEK